ncbi:hypothetical protein B0H11DRAFT_2252600 [Mycena galericulata]|nr:hypothetical protein B0H11DRAFT_2252600 [Mycena galericulata]
MPSTTEVLDSIITATWILSIFYGLFVALFLGSLSVQAFSPPTHHIKAGPRSVISGRLLLGTTVTCHFIYSLRRFREAFFIVDASADPLEIHSDYSRASAIRQSGFLFATVFIADVLLIRRLWRTWASSRWVITFLLISVLGLSGESDFGCVCGIKAIHALTLPEGSVIDLAGSWSIRAGLFNLIINVVGCLGFISLAQKYEDSHELPMDAQATMTPAVTYAHGATLTSLWSAILLCACLFGAPMRFLLDVTPVMFGILSMIVYVRIELTETHAAASITLPKSETV